MQNVITVKCKICDQTFTKYPSVLKSCCSKECLNKFRLRNRVPHTCSVCGHTDLVPKSKNKSKTPVCGNPVCIATFISKRQLGSTNSNYKGVVFNTLCTQCGIAIKKYNKQGKFCSLNCKAVWQRTHLTGGNNPFYGKTHSESTRRFFSKNNSKGRAITINRELRHTASMKNWRNNIFKRDRYTCKECGATNGNGVAVFLNAHHIKRLSLLIEHCPFKYLYTGDKFYFLHNFYFYDLENGVTLCNPCHCALHNNMNIKKIAHV